MTNQYFGKAKALIDAANSEDPNRVTCDGRDWPKELLYSKRMSEMLERFAPKADDAMKLAVSAQHIQRWKSPRSDYPMNRKGYYQWRAALCQFHADTLAGLLNKAGYDDEFITRTTQAVAKKSLKTNSDSQLLEDIAGLVFLQYYFLDFVDKHPEYNEEKWFDIIRRMWQKLSVRARQYAFGNISLPPSLTALIRKAVSETS
ncbi:MAG: DUF4202 domain-containing protein [Nitrosomonas sp. PRO4]|nr:DUF4202 domain-containing protein [Nitrosomonas sp. PRO4]